jgi:hypothetical protein
VCLGLPIPGAGIEICVELLFTIKIYSTLSSIIGTRELDPQKIRAQLFGKLAADVETGL